VGQVVIGLVVAMIIGAFVLGGGAMSAAGLSKECAAEVGDHCVDPKEYYAAYGLMSSIGLNEKAAKQLQLRAQIAEGLIERELLLEEAKRLGIAVSEKELDEELASGRTRVSLPAARAESLALQLAMCVEGPGGCAPGTIGLRALPVLRNGVLDYERYARMVRVATGRSPSHFKEQQKRELTAERVRELIRSGVRVSEEETFAAFERGRSKATVRTVTAPGSWFARYVNVVSDAQVEDWTVEHKAEVDSALAQQKDSWKADCPLVSEIRVDLDPAATDEEKQQKRELLGTARARAQKGEDFALLAREFSDGAEAADGGRLGCLSERYGAGAQALLQATGELEAGKLSDVIESPRGLHLLKLHKKVPEAELEATARQHVARRLATEGLAKETAKRFAQELISKVQGGQTLEAAAEDLTRAYAEGGPLKPAKGAEHPALASSVRPKVEISRPFSRDQNPLPAARAGKSPAALAFQLEKDDAVHGEPLETSDGFAVLQLKSKDLADREAFKEEKAELMAQFRSRKADEALTKYVDGLRKRAGSVLMNPRHVPVDGDEPAGES
jgi:peptidyl-prolyl cis-trans isomerase D